MPETYSYVNTPPGPVLPGSPVYGDYSHRLQAVGTSPRTYDAVGNTLTGLPALSAQNAQAEYDARNRLTGLKVGTSSYLARYEYNGRGERVVRHVGGVVHLFVYDESGQLLGRYATDTAPGSSWTLDEEIVWLENTPIASVRIESGQPVVRAILSDHLNSPRALSALHGGSQPAGTLVWKWSLTSRTPAGNNAYGNEAPDEDPDGNGAAVKFDLRFPGQQAEAESGTHYNYFRDYEAGTGRYIESDPLGLADGPATFGYAGANTILKRDSKGLAVNEIVGFDPPKADLVKGAIDKAIETIKNCKGCVCRGQPDGYCITEPQRQALIATLSTMTVEYNSVPAYRPSDCGQRRGANFVVLYDPAFSDRGCCLNKTPNALAAALTHEAAHILDLPKHPQQYWFVEQTCFGCEKW